MLEIGLNLLQLANTVLTNEQTNLGFIVEMLILCTAPAEILGVAHLRDQEGPSALGRRTGTERSSRCKNLMIDSDSMNGKTNSCGKS